MLRVKAVECLRELSEDRKHHGTGRRDHSNPRQQRAASSSQNGGKR